jgi:hypothetical protein
MKTEREGRDRKGQIGKPDRDKDLRWKTTERAEPMVQGKGGHPDQSGTDPVDPEQSIDPAH